MRSRVNIVILCDGYPWERPEEVKALLIEERVHLFVLSPVKQAISFQCPTMIAMRLSRDHGGSGNFPVHKVNTLPMLVGLMSLSPSSRKSEVRVFGESPLADNLADAMVRMMVSPVVRHWPHANRDPDEKLNLTLARQAAAAVGRLP